MSERYKIRGGLNLDEDAAEKHLAALREVGVCDKYPEQLGFLYENLNILDGKASSLLSFNAIGLASLAIWLTGVPLNYFHLALDIAWLLFLISCGFCLKIVWLHWASTENLLHDGQHAVALVKHRDHRTMSYRRAWWLSTIAVGITGLASVYHTVLTAMEAFGIGR